MQPAYSFNRAAFNGFVSRGVTTGDIDLDLDAIFDLNVRVEGI